MKKTTHTHVPRLTPFILLMLANGTSHAFGEPPPPPKPIFKLTQGQGTEVCEAYLQRLDKTEFLDNDPTQGRVHEPLLDGFADLKPVPLTAEEIQRLYYKIKSFREYQDQHLLEKYNALHQDDPGVKQRAERLPEEVKTLMKDRLQTPFVRYQVTLDLDNDGFASNTVIEDWNGVYIVDPPLQQLDEDRMKAIFADQEILDWPSVVQFPPLAVNSHVFGYKGKYYFDGLLDVLLGVNSRTRTYYPYAPLMLGIFIHEQYQTRQVCEYQWLNGEVYQARPYHSGK